MQVPEPFAGHLLCPPEVSAELNKRRQQMLQAAALLQLSQSEMAHQSLCAWEYSSLAVLLPSCLGAARRTAVVQKD